MVKDTERKMLADLIDNALLDSLSSLPDKERAKLSAILANKIAGKFYFIAYNSQISFE